MTVPEFSNDEEVHEDEPDLMDDAVWNHNVERVIEKMNEDPANRDRVIAETYMFLRTMEQGMRKMLASGGPLGMIQNMMGGKKVG